MSYKIKKVLSDGTLQKLTLKENTYNERVNIVNGRGECKSSLAYQTLLSRGYAPDNDSQPAPSKPKSDKKAGKKK